MKYAGILACMLLVSIVGANATFAHSGGTDKNGCHYDHKHGGYHCH